MEEEERSPAELLFRLLTVCMSFLSYNNIDTFNLLFLTKKINYERFYPLHTEIPTLYFDFFRHLLFKNHIPGLEQRVIGFIGLALSVRAAHLSGTCPLSAPAFSGGFCRKIETQPEPHPSKCKGLQIWGGATVAGYLALIVGAVLSRPMLT